jgi:secreted Zn-dependent insulinase-like peptidase
MKKTIYEMALEYYPKLWNKARIEALVAAGKLTEEQAKEITGGDEDVH